MTRGGGAGTDEPADRGQPPSAARRGAQGPAAGPGCAGSAPCPLCAPAPLALWQNDELQVVAAHDSPIPGFTRVIWKAHVREMSDLDAAARNRLMRVVWLVEEALRACLQPHKVNVASLGNQVPHLHWHVIPRWPEDPWFPDPVWSPASGQRLGAAAWTDRCQRTSRRLDSYHGALAAALQGLQAR